MALHEESSACSPCSLFPALRGSSLQVQEWGSCSQGEGGLGTGTGAGCGKAQGVFTWMGMGEPARGSCFQLQLKPR